MMKRKILIPVLAVMLCVGMIGVGFAAWVIATQTTANIENGTQFTAYPVTNKSVQFGTLYFDNADVTFGATATKYDPQWITLEEGATEDMKAVLVIPIKNWSDVNAEGKTVTLKLTMLINDNEATTNIYKDKYVKLPAKQIEIKDGVLQGSDAEVKLDTDTGILTVDLVFGWGSYFNNQNPNDFYNDGHSANDTMKSGDPGYDATCNTYMAHANKHLGVLKDLNNVKFKVYLTADLDIIAGSEN